MTEQSTLNRRIQALVAEKAAAVQATNAEKEKLAESEVKLAEKEKELAVLTEKVKPALCLPRPRDLGAAGKAWRFILL